MQLEKPIFFLASQEIRRIFFMESESLLQKLPTCLSAEPNKSSPSPPSYFFLRSILILPSKPRDPV
jgi:hypothetical protein